MKYVYLLSLFAVATKAIGGIMLAVSMCQFWELPIIRRLILLPASVGLSGLIVFVVQLILLEERGYNYLLVLISFGYLITGATCLYLTLLMWGVVGEKDKDEH